MTMTAMRVIVVSQATTTLRAGFFVLVRVSLLLEVCGGLRYARGHAWTYFAARGMEMGEVYQLDLTVGAPDWPEGKPWQWREPVGYIFPRGWGMLKDLPLTAGQWRVLMALLEHCDWGNICRVSSAQLGRELRLSGSWVARVLRSLLPYQLLILETGRGDRAQTIVLSPLLCWKGRPWHLAYARRQFLAAWDLRYSSAMDAASAHGRLGPGPDGRAAREDEHPPGGRKDWGAGPFTHYPPRPQVGSL